MNPKKTSPSVNRSRFGLLDPFRWLWDLLIGFLLMWVSILLLGRRPPGCRPVNVDTPDGAYYGCGRAYRYGVPGRFVSLCRQCRTHRDSQGDEHILCGIGKAPLFALRMGLFLPLASLCAIVFFGTVVFQLYSWGLFDGILEVEGKPRTPPITFDRLYLGKERLNQVRENARRKLSPEERAARKAARQAKELSRTVTKPRITQEVELAPVPAALERFREVTAGPSDRGDVPEGRSVPQPISRVSSADLATPEKPVAGPKEAAEGN